MTPIVSFIAYVKPIITKVCVWKCADKTRVVQKIPPANKLFEEDSYEVLVGTHMANQRRAIDLGNSKIWK